MCLNTLITTFIQIIINITKNYQKMCKIIKILNVYFSLDYYCTICFTLCFIIEDKIKNISKNLNLSLFLSIKHNLKQFLMNNYSNHSNYFKNNNTF